jgi:hypothetical protein
MEIAVEGKPTGRWRLTATSDEDGGGPFGDESHDHATAEEALACEKCDEYCARVTGFHSRRDGVLNELKALRELAECVRAEEQHRKRIGRNLRKPYSAGEWEAETEACRREGRALRKRRLRLLRELGE